MNSNLQEFTGLKDLKEGFLSGTIFNNIVDEYKEFDYTLVGNQELLNLQAISFVILDLNLFLDNQSDDKEVLKLINEYVNKYKKLKMQYENKYGPLTVTGDNLGDNYFKWVHSPWPWENKGQ